MPMSFGGHVASSSACATRPEVGEIGLSGFAAPTRHSSPIGRYVMATAGHREPCESRGSCTVLGAPEGESPSGDSSYRYRFSRDRFSVDVRYAPFATELLRCRAMTQRGRLCCKTPK